MNTDGAGSGIGTLAFARVVRFDQVIAVEGEDAWAFGVGSTSGGGVDVSGELGRAADQVAEGGGRGRRVTGPDLGFVFSRDDTSHPVGGVSHGPGPRAQEAISAALACSADRSVMAWTVSLDDFFAP